MSIIETLNSKSILEYIDGKYKDINLESYGDGTYRSVCPLHDGAKNPSSFAIFDENNFYCFSCGSGGKLIDFVMEKEGYSFQQAITTLAKDFGYNLKQDEKYQKQMKISDEVERGIKEFEGHLGEAYDYLSKERGLSDEVIKQYHLGYWEKGNAITIPQYNIHGLPVGFLYRFLDSTPKYKNSNNNELYVKGSHLFNSNNVRKLAKRNRRLFVCEGAFDAMSMYQLGEACVAYFGISVTRNHVSLIKDLTERIEGIDIILVPDNDGKANKFVVRARELFRQIYPQANVLVADLGG